MTEDNLKKKTISGLFWKIAERTASQIVRMVVMIVLARLLMPEDYGAIALVMVFISICDVIIVSGLGSPLIQKKNADSLDFSTIFYCSAGVGVLLFAFVFWSAPFVARFYDMDILCPVLRVLSVGIIFSSIGSVQNAYVSRSMNFKAFFFATFWGTIISGVIGILMAYNGYGIWAIVGQYLSSQIASIIIVYLFVRWKPTKEFSWQRLRTMWSFGWKVFAAALINNIFTDLRTILIGKFYTKQELAYFNQGNQYPTLMVTTVTTTINSVLFPAISKIQDDLPVVRAFLRRSIKQGSFLLFPLLLGFAATAEPLVLLLLTEKWLPSVPFIQVMCLSLFLEPISTPSLQAIKAIGRSDVTMKQEFIKKTVALLMIIVGVTISVWGVVIANAIAHVWFVIVNTYPCKKYIGYSFKEQITDVLPNFLLASLMAFVIYLITMFKLHPFVTLLIQIPLGSLIYIGLAAVTKNESYLYYRNELVSIKKNHTMNLVKELYKKVAQLFVRLNREDTLRNLVNRRKYEKSLLKLKNVHKGKRCFIIGNGPSLTASDLTLLKNEITFASNRIFYIFNKTEWRPTYYCGQDIIVMRDIADKLEPIVADAKNIFLSSRCWKYMPKGIKNNINVLFFKPRYKAGHDCEVFSDNIDQFVTDGGTVTFAAIQVAVYMGITEIYLIGCDHNYSSSSFNNNSISKEDVAGSYFEGMPTGIKMNAPRTDNSTLSFILAKEYCEAHGIKIFNATRGGKLEVYERKKLEDILKDNFYN